MIQPITAPKNVVAYRASGTIEEDEVKKVVDQIEKSLEDYPKISFYSEFGELDGMTAPAFFRDLGAGIKQLKNVDRFERAAVVTESDWVEKIANFEDSLLGVDIKVFSTEQKDEALTWASGIGSR